jgi:tetratricopeptide (TPR) repeat protein
MITAETLDALDTTVETLIAKEMLTEAAEAVAQLDEWYPGDLVALRRGVTILRKARRLGRALVLIERYRASFPADIDAALDEIEIRSEGGVNKLSSVLWTSLEALPLETTPHRLRAAKLWRRVGRNDIAVEKFAELARLHPDNVEIHQQWIETASWSRQFKQSRQALAQLQAIAPDHPYWFAFMAEHAIRAGDTRLFRKMAAEAEAKAAGKDGVARIILARAFSVRGDRRGIDRVLSGVAWSEITAEWVFSSALDLADEHMLRRHHLPIARRVLNVTGLSGKLTGRCREIVKSYDMFVPKI